MSAAAATVSTSTLHPRPTPHSPAAQPLPAALVALTGARGDIRSASELGLAQHATCSTGYALLDAELPGAGWPCGHLTEVLQAQAGLHEWRLLLPALRARQGQGALLLVGSPHWPNLSALACSGIAPQSVLLIEAAQPAQRLWVAEQALRCRDLAALLVWLPQARAEALRRLQWAAQSLAQSATQLPLLFAFRPLAAQHESSPAPLRLSVCASQGPPLALQLLKRRGPPLARTLLLPSPWPPALAQRQPALPPSRLPAQSVPPAPPLVSPAHVVDRPGAPLRIVPRAHPAHA